MIKYNIPMDQYRAMQGLSKHELDNFAIAPAYYKHRKGQEWRPSRSMELGTCIHSLVLEGRKDYAVGPQVDRRTKAGKDEWQLFCEDNIGKIIITPDEEALINGCFEACAPLLNHCEYDANRDVETSMFWERDGIRCKGRPDMICTINGELSIVDLKTTTEIASFESKFYRFRYDVQAAWYQYGLKKSMALSDTPAFWFLVVDTEAPHLCQFMRPATDLLASANAKIETDLAYFKRCEQAQDWPGLPEFRLILSNSWQ